MRGNSVPSDHDPQYDCQTLCRAEEIRKDSGRMKAAKRYAEEMSRSVVGRKKAKREKVRE